MENIEDFLNGQSSASIGREMTPWEHLMSRVRGFFQTIRIRYIPSLVWRHQEIDVSIGIKLTAHTELDALARAETILRDLGFSFDTGYGFGQRDWEWDWSLKGPVSIKFEGKRLTPRDAYGFTPKNLLGQEHDLIVGSGLLKSK